MLGKLLKHEFKASGRIILPLYLVLAVLTLMNRITFSLRGEKIMNIISNFLIFTYVISIIAVVAVSFVIVVLRFYRNLMLDEGYLMFTLPVKTSQLITSKLIAASIWTLLSFLATIASVSIVFFSLDRIGLLGSLWDSILLSLGQYLSSGQITLFFTELIISVILQMINSLLMIYTSIAIGQLSNGHKLLGSVAAYVGISTVLQTIVSVIAVMFGTLFPSIIADVSSVVTTVLPLTFIYNLVSGALFYAVTHFILKKKLNLE
ncbi:hypothetical protein HNQ56_004191 [Anaerotaenia torta]|uniref:hypothetical protein n=1 Tax=Anaerotaenia torta TaxID=433293 RepID=UPI003D25063E